MIRWHCMEFTDWAAVEEWKAGHADPARAAVAAAKAAKAAKDAEERVLSAGPPPSLDAVVGNRAAVLQIQTALDAHQARRKDAGSPGRLAFPHLLLTGPGGTGKGMLSAIIASELGAKLHEEAGQTLTNPARVQEALLKLAVGDVLFVDELHGLKVPCQEALYRAMEERLLIPVKAGRAKAGEEPAKPVKLPPFTVIGATTDEWALAPSLIQRFKYRVRLRRLSTAEMVEALGQRADRMGVSIDQAATEAIAARSLGTPRLALGLLDGCRDFALAQELPTITAPVVEATCRLWELDSLGLSHEAQTYMRKLAEAGGPVKLNVLASHLGGLPRATVERKIEPDLIFLGLIEKESEGRRLTAAGREHLNLNRKG